MEDLIFRFGAAFCSGFILSQAGSLIQLGTRNILASPSTLGGDGIAVLWLLLGYLGGQWLGFEAGPTMLFILGAPLMWAMAYWLGRSFKQNFRIEILLLLGMTFNLLIGAFFSLTQFFAIAFNFKFPTEVWFGHFRYADAWSFVASFLGALSLAICIWVKRKELLLFSLGPGIFNNWGLREEKLQRFIFVTVLMATFLVVSFFGAFAFLGLIFPILARRWWFERSDLMGEFFPGAFVNGLLLMLIDFGCYFFPFAGAEIPVGLIASLIGAACLTGIVWTTFKHR